MTCKRSFMAMTAGIILSASAALASNVDFNVGINVGNAPPRPVTVARPTVVLEEPPVFIAPPRLGYYTAVGVPYDLFFNSGRYYLNQGGIWFSASSYIGPWLSIEVRSLPREMRRYPLERVRYIREAEYRRYRDDDHHYRGRHFKPEKRWKEMKEEEKERRREEKHREKEHRKHGHGHGHDD